MIFIIIEVYVFGKSDVFATYYTFSGNFSSGYVTYKAVSGSNALYANKKLDEDMLYVKEIRLDEGPRLKRVWFRGKGRADMLLRRMCHISVVVDEKAGE